MEKAFAIVFYPDSCKLVDFKKIVIDRYPCCISPLHSRDLTENGDLKKPHYHVLFLCTLTAYDKRLLSSLTKTYYFERVKSAYDYYHYLYHWNPKSNWYIPNKSCYWSGDIWHSRLFSLQTLRYARDDSDYLDIIYTIIRTNHFYEFCDLTDFILQTEDTDLIKYFLSKHQFFKCYVDSRRFKKIDFDKKS